jgi:hypothetical protein
LRSSEPGHALWLQARRLVGGDAELGALAEERTTVCSQAPEILEDFEPLLNLKEAFVSGERNRFDQLLGEIAAKLAKDYRAQIRDKVCRWATATAVPRFYDSPPVRAYIQAKMLYRDGFYDATIMVSRSIAEMVCYDRLDRVAHPFGSGQQVEGKNFRQLIEWLHKNDASITTKVFERLNALYDLGNQYIHPKSGQNAKDDSLQALHLIGESVFDIYGVKTAAEMVGKTIRTPMIGSAGRQAKL